MSQRRELGALTLLGVAVGLVLCVPLWGGRPPAGDDVTGHLVRNAHGLSMLADFQVSGWTNRFMLGHDQFLFYGPGFTVALGLVRIATGGLLSTVGAFKVVAIASVVAVAPATVFLARSLRVPPLAAGVAGLFALLVSCPFGVGWAATFEIGLVPHQLAAPVLLVALGSIVRLAVDGWAPWGWLTVATVGALVVTHPISVMVLVILVATATLVLAAGRLLSVAAFSRLAVAAVLAFGVAAFWVVPRIVHHELRGPVATWPTPPIGDRLSEIVTGTIAYPERFGWLVVVGLLFGLVKVVRGHRLVAVAVLGPPLFLLVGHTAYRIAPRSEVGLLLANRGLGYAALVAVIPAAWLVASLASRAVRERPRLAAATAVGAALALLVFLPGGHREKAKQMPQAVPAMHRTAAYLAEAVPPTGRVAVERDYPAEIAATGVTHPNLWLAWKSGANELNVFNGESSVWAWAGYVPDRIGVDDPFAVAGDLEGLGVTHVITVRPGTPEQLEATGLFRTVYDDGPLAVLRFDPLEPGMRAPLVQLDADGEALTLSADDDTPSFAVSASRRSVATVAIGWSPKWHAYIDGEPAAIGRSDDGRMRVAVPAGEHRLDLRYRPDGWDRLGGSISIATIGGITAAALRRRRRIR